MKDCEASSVAVASPDMLGCMGVAQAADLPARMAPAPYIAPLPIFTWTGAYFGINAGAAFDFESRATNAGLNLTGVTAGDNGVGSTRPGSFKNRTIDGVQWLAARSDTTTSSKDSGGLGGFGGGGVVIGVEADADYTDSAKSANLCVASATTGLPSVNNFKLGSSIISARFGAALGYAFNQFSNLWHGRLCLRRNFRDKDCTLYAPVMLLSGALITAAIAIKRRQVIPTGGGVEYALPTGSFLNFFKSSAVTIKAEYLSLRPWKHSSFCGSRHQVVSGSDRQCL